MLVERDRTLLGFAASRYDGQRLILGPVVMQAQLRTKGLLMLRAVLGLEAVYTQAGVTSYVLGSSDPAVQRVIEAWGCPRIAQEQGEVWYRRDLAPQKGGAYLEIQAT
jgi:hypothetical protein